MPSKELYKFRKENHLCVYCGKPSGDATVCPEHKAQIKGYSKKNKWTSSRNQPQAVKQEESPVEFSGEIIPLQSLAQLPKKVPYLMRSSKSELLDAYKHRFNRAPDKIYEFKRTMDTLYYAPTKRTQDEKILSDLE